MYHLLLILKSDGLEHADHDMVLRNYRCGLCSHTAATNAHMNAHVPR